MSLLKSIAAGAAVSLVIANLIRGDGGGDGGLLQFNEATVLGQRVAWSWPLFAVATIAVWALFKALDQSSIR